MRQLAALGVTRPLLLGIFMPSCTLPLACALGSLVELRIWRGDWVSLLSAMVLSRFRVCRLRAAPSRKCIVPERSPRRAARTRCRHVDPGSVGRGDACPSQAVVFFADLDPVTQLSSRRHVALLCLVAQGADDRVDVQRRDDEDTVRLRRGFSLGCALASFLPALATGLDPLKPPNGPDCSVLMRADSFRVFSGRERRTRRGRPRDHARRSLIESDLSLRSTPCSA
jgi:hypothetical protein